MSALKLVAGFFVVFLSFCVQSGSSIHAAGAYAYGKPRTVVIVTNLPNEDAARAAAIRQCQITSSNCEIVETFRRTCVAVARPVDARDANWNAFDNDLTKAENRAIEACQNRHGIACRVITSHCDTQP